MIAIKNEKTGESLNIAERWEEVYYQTYVDLKKLESSELNEYQRLTQYIAYLSDNPDKCKEWLGKMTLTQFEELCTSIKLSNIDKVKSTNKSSIKVDGKTYIIVKNYDDMTMDEMSHFEALKGRFKGTEDYVLAFGLLLREADEHGNAKDFTIESFDWIVNNLAPKVKMVDMFQHVAFFLRGVKKQSVKTGVNFSISKKK